MAKVILNDVSSLANTASAKQLLNDNFDAIEVAVENTVSRDGTTPNAMEADFDLGDHKLLNVKDPVAEADGVNLRSLNARVDEHIGEIAELIIEGTLRVDLFTATSLQTDFTLTDSPGIANNMQVFDNGIAMTPGVDFTLTGAALKTLHFLVGRLTGAKIVARYVQLSPSDSLLRADLLSAQTTKGASIVTWSPPDSLALAQGVDRHLANAPSPTWYATDAQLAVDATTATQKAIDYAISSGRKAVYFPGGRTYKYPAASAALNPGDGDMTLYGDGKHTSILKYDEGTSGADLTLRKNLFHNYTGTLKGKLEFRGLQFQGMWSESGYSGAFVGGTTMLLKNYEEITIRDCLFTNLRSYVTAVEYAGRAYIDGCQFIKNGRDLFRFRSTPNQIVQGCYFQHNDDDGIALHSNFNDTGGTIREGIVVRDCILEDTGGIKVLAGRMVTIDGNMLIRTKQYGIAVFSDAGAAAPEANSQMFSINITNNTVYDHLPDYSAGFGSGGVSGVILVTSRQPQAGADTLSTIPGQNRTVSGTFIDPYPSRDSTYTSGNGVAAMYGVRIQNNTIMRTQRAVGTYSSWGKGLMYANDGTHDPAVTAANMRPSNAIIMAGQARKVLIQGNHIGHVGNGVLFDTINDNFGADGVLIQGNIFTEFTGAAVTFTNPLATRTVNVVVDSNFIDADPYQLDPNRAVNGGWDDAATPTAVSALSHFAVVVSNNKMRNLSRPVENGGSPSTISLRNNTLRSQPAGVNYNASSRGIGNNPIAGEQYNYEIVDSNPTSATYGQLTNLQLRESFGMPSTGYYVQGAFVRNTNTGLNVFGYLRLTTGSGHVAGTDWKSVAIA